jgi:hypothetical protein
MANQSVLELAVGTGKWDAGLKKAKQSLDNFTQANGGLQQALGKDSESMQKFVRMMGQMDSTAKTAKGQMNDYKSTIEQLTMQYNRMTDAQKKVIGQDYLQTIEQMKQKYQSVNEEIQEMNRSLNNVKLPDMKDGGLFSGMGDKMSGALQVFAGNMLTKGVSMLTSELAGSVQESIELARQGEGIRIAFERLGRGDLLDSLRQATHGTITDLELMKAAVRFDDFKLPLDQLGTMLAFAQQKAKDTGQSFDYMVDSIVTGLGRQSPKILDNLGLSITEIHQKTKETGDMTKAVGEIIREQMEKAGDYVETAADRAARATVDTKNKMEEFGRSAAPVAEEFAQVWRALSISAMDFANTLLGPVADSIRSLQNIWNNGWEDNIINSKFNLENGNYTPPKTGYQGMGKLQSVAAPGGYVEVTDKNTGTVIGGRHFENLSDKNSIKDWQKSLLKNSNKGGNSTKKEQTELQQNQTKINALTQEYVKLGDDATEAARKRQEDIRKEIALLEERNNLLAVRAEQAKGKLLNDIPGVSMEVGGGVVTKTMQDTMDNVMPKDGLKLDEKAMKAVNKQITDQNNKKIKDSEKSEVSMAKEMSGMAGGVSQMVGGLEQLGIEIPQGMKDVLGGIQAISTILSGIMAIVSAIEVIAGADTIIPFARGGVVKAAGGTLVGTSYSGDNLRGIDPSGQIYGLNAGEVVLNRAQVSTLASTLEGSGMQGLKLSATISGEQIRLVLNNNGRRTGKGEYVQTNFR